MAKKLSISPTLLRWLTLGTVGSIFFTLVYTVEGMTRPGYSPWRQAISALSLGPGGWVQQVNFIIFGVISVLTAIAWRKFLSGGPGAVWYPIFRTLQGVGLIVDGFVSQDPAAGYPPGSVAVSPTTSGTIHLAFASLTITSMALGFFVLARRFARQPHWRGWATYSVVTGILTIVFITVFGILNGQQSGIAGVFERLATVPATVWGIIFFTRLWRGTTFRTFSSAKH